MDDTRFNLPVMVKETLSASGNGVGKIETIEQFEDFPQRGGKLRQSKRWLARRLLEGIIGIRDMPQYEVQKFLTGKPAMFAGLAHRGTLLWGQGYLPTKHDRNDPFASSIETIQTHDACNRRMEHEAKKLTMAMCISGFVSFDFMIGDSNLATVIECNARLIRAPFDDYPLDGKKMVQIFLNTLA